MNLKRLLLLQAIVTFASFIVLVVSPTAIPASFDIRLTPDQYIFPYLIGATELALAYLSLASRKIEDVNALRIVCFLFITFHATTGILCFYGLLQGIFIKIIGNILIRILMVILFCYYGIHKTKGAQK